MGRANRRLLRDLAAVGTFLNERPTARERLESELGIGLTRAVERSLGSGPSAPAFGRSSRAA